MTSVGSVKLTQQQNEQPRIPNIDKIIAYENGEMTEEEMTTFFQELINSGDAFTLQGSYGRMAKHLIEVGICHVK